MGAAGRAMSERESQVLAAVAEHLSNAEIARRLHISVRTVESHVSSLLRKLGAADRRALAGYGRELAGREEAGEARGGGPPGLQGAPAALTSFIGRHPELEAVEGALAAARLVNLAGPGGVGKTRLGVQAATAAAPRFPGGAWFVDLVPVRAGGVATAVAAAIGVVDRPNRSLEQVIEASLRPRRALLVLDNCEHVLGEAATLIERLLVGCPGLRVLATSRELLGVTGERVVPVASLDEADAVQLFVERVRALDPAFDADAGRDAAAEVCARLDGIPLAIELASARCAVLGLDGVRAGLGDRLRLLDLAGRRAGGRHRSLRAVLDWSHGLLDPTEQAVFRRLAVFAGDVTATDASAVVSDDTGAVAGAESPAAGGAAVDATAAHAAAAGGVAPGRDPIGDGEVVAPGRDPIGEGEAVEAIAGLTAKSLLVRRTAGGTSVYRLLETVHDYARARLAESGEEEAVRRRHLGWARAAAADAERRLVEGREWRAAFDALADDVRLALAWARDVPDLAGPAHELARSHAHLAYARRFLSEAQAAYEQAATLAGDGDRAATADLRQAGAVAFARMRGDLAYEHYLAAAERGARAGADKAGAAMALADAATLAWRCPAEFPTVRSRDEVLALAERARALDPGGDPLVAAHLVVAEAWLACRTPAGADLARARAAVKAAQAAGDVPLLSTALDAETSALWEEGAVGEAARVADRRLELLDRLTRHDPRTGGEVIDIFHMAADTALAAGQCRQALDHAALMRKDEMGETSPHAATREAVVALTLLGRFAEAIAEADAMRRDWEQAGRPQAGWMTPAATAAHLAHALLGDRAAAAEWAAVTDEVAGGTPPRSANRAFIAFTHARAALHDGRIDDALRAVDGWDPTVPSGHVGYVAALDAELAVVAGRADAADRIAAARARIDENAWGRAGLLRAAADAFDEMDARFEWAVTALLAGEPLAARGRAVLAELGATPPRP